MSAAPSPMIRPAGSLPVQPPRLPTESTVRCLGIEVDAALAIAEQVDV
jgi:hypothetical protein